MLCIYYPGRHNIQLLLRNGRLGFRALYSSSGNDTDSSDDEKAPRHKTKPQHFKNKEALDKLNTLLQSMVKQDVIAEEPSPVDAQLARPKKMVKKAKEILEKEKKEEVKPTLEAAEDAARAVAQALGGDVERTQSELLSKLRSQSQTAASVNLGELIAGMKIDRSKKTEQSDDSSRAHQVRQLLGRRQRQQLPPRMAADVTSIRRPSSGRVDLFGSEPLGIFSKEVVAAGEAPAEPQLEMWEKLHRRELRVAVTHPPANIFQEMILWTEQGKLWKFPINNEQGLEQEATVPFEDHVFLERYLEPWCPQRGPVRHFMELVCVGLSKNSFVTAEEKRQHIEWYRNYFASKEDLLKEVGAIQ